MNSSGGSKVVQFKLVLLGDSAVGKSSLVLRFVRGQFFEYQESTIGAAFLTQVRPLSLYPALPPASLPPGNTRPVRPGTLQPPPTNRPCVMDTTEPD